MAERDLVELLQRVDLLSGLSKRQLSALAEKGREATHPDGHDVVEEEAGGVGLHVVLDGSATVFVHGQERRKLGPGDYFGEISLIDGLPRSATVRAESGLRTLVITAWNFGSFLEKNPEVARHMLVTLCSRLRESDARGV